MAKPEIIDLLRPIDRLYSEIVQFVPQDNQRIQFRSDLAGLLVVSIAASYENCVKETLVSFCMSQSPVFGVFASIQYEKLNSRINLSDLHAYSKLFGEPVQSRLKDNLSKRKQAILTRTGRDICTIYDQILTWRHQYAHAGQQNTTVEEAYMAHTFAKRVILTFSSAIS